MRDQERDFCGSSMSRTGHQQMEHLFVDFSIKAFISSFFFVKSSSESRFFPPRVVFQLILFISWGFMQQVVFFAALLLFYFQNLNVKTYTLPKERCQNVFHCFSNSDEDLSYLLFLLDLTPVFVPLFFLRFYQASSCSFISFLFWIFFSLDSDFIFSPDLLVLTAVAYVLPALSLSCVLLLLFHALSFSTHTLFE